MRVLVPVLLLAAAAAAGEEWRCPRGDLQNTGVAKNRGPVAKPQVAWKREEKEMISRGVALAAGKLVYGVGEYVVNLSNTPGCRPDVPMAARSRRVGNQENLQASRSLTSADTLALG